LKPRRILYVTLAADGGQAAVVERLAKGLDRDRYEPVVLFDTAKQSFIRDRLSESNIKTIDLRKNEDEQVSIGPKASKNRDVGSKVEAFLGKKARHFYFSLKALREFVLRQAPKISLLVKIIRENNIDLVHTHQSIVHGKPEIIAARIVGVPCISHRHGYSKLTHFDLFFAKFVDAFIYVSRDVAEDHISQGEPQKKGIVIHNGVDIGEFEQSFDKMKIRNEFGCKSDEPLVGIIGRIDWWKGHEYFLEAIAIASRKFPILKGVIIGEFEKGGAVNLNRKHTQKVKSLVRSLGIEGKIIFTGFRSDVSRLMSGLDMIIHASSEPEPFGLVVIEGMAAGKPVVATAAGGVLDIIENGVSGILVPCKDSTAIADAIITILYDPEKAEQMGCAGRRHVEENFSIEHQVAAVQSLYDSFFLP